MNNEIKYEQYKIGIYKSDDEQYSATVLFVTERKRYVTLWRNHQKIKNETMSKKDWEQLRDSYDLIMVDVKTMELPIL